MVGIEEFIPSIITRASAAVGGFLGLYALINGYIALQHRRMRKNSDEEVRLAKESVALAQKNLAYNKEIVLLLKGGLLAEEKETKQQSETILSSSEQQGPIIVQHNGGHLGVSEVPRTSDDVPLH